MDCHEKGPPGGTLVSPRNEDASRLPDPGCFTNPTPVNHARGDITLRTRAGDRLQFPMRGAFRVMTPLRCLDELRVDAREAETGTATGAG